MKDLIDLSTPDFVAIITAIFGLVFSLFAHKRAKVSEARSERAEIRSERAEARAMEASREVNSLAYAQRKNELLASIISGEAAHLNVMVQAQDLRDEAEETGVPEANLAIDQANHLIDESEKALKLLEESRSALQSVVAKNKSHDDLVYLVEEHSEAVRAFTDKSKIEAEAAAILQPARRLLRLIRSGRRGGPPPP